MTFSPSIGFMYFFFGVLNGCGCGMAVVSAQVLCGAHYNKYRGLTSSFVLSGNGGGATVFPLVINHLMESYGWHGSLLLLCGLNLHLLPMALLLFPVKEKIKYIETEIMLEHVTEEETRKDHDFANIEETHERSLTQIPTMNSETNSGGKFKNHITKIIKVEFLVFLFSSMTNQMGLGAVVIFLPQYSISLGLSSYDASLSLSLVGVGFFVGCVLAGFLGNHSHLMVYTVGCLGFGIFIILMEVFHTRTIHMCLSTLSGCFAGLQFAPLFIITNRILGDKTLDVGFGYVMFAVGIGLTAGPPVAGLLIDVFGETKYVVYFSCVVTVLSGIVMIPLLVGQLLKKFQTSS